uniref:Uncharacterized protein n=1 Tax=Chenopodium quinoa TaxID=63459 RepID=A0A803MMN7_CHEQI
MVDDTKIDPASLFYLGSGDQPGNLITNVILKSDNYLSWSRAISLSLKSRRKFGFVDGTISKPTDKKKLLDWDTVNSMLVSWILRTIDPKLAISIPYFDDAKRLWDYLDKRYCDASGPRLQQLRASITNCKQLSTMTVEDYYNQLIGYFDDLARLKPPHGCECGACSCGVAAKYEKDRDEEILHQFLVGIDDAKYALVRTNLLSQQPPATLERSYHALLQEEHSRSIAQAKIPATKEDAHVFALPSSDRRQFQSARVDKAKLFCSHCKRSGHDTTGCFLLHGFPDWWLEKYGKKGGASHSGSSVSQQGSKHSASASTAAVAASSSKPVARANAMGGSIGPPVVPSTDTLSALSELKPEHVRLLLNMVTNNQQEKMSGYPHGKKGWKLYDLDTGEIFVSRDVKFFENEFPFVKGNEPVSSLENVADMSHENVGVDHDFLDDLEYILEVGEGSLVPEPQPPTLATSPATARDSSPHRRPPAAAADTAHTAAETAGNLHQVASKHTLPHRRFAELAKRYGRVMQLQLGQVPTIIVSSADMAKEVMKTHDSVFCNRPIIMIAKEVFYNCTDIGLAPYGEYWRNVRKISVLELFTSKRVQSFQPIRVEEVTNLINSLASEQGRVVNLTRKAYFLSCDTLTRSAFSTKGNEQEPFRKLLSSVTKHCTGFCSADLYPSIPFLHRISGMKRNFEIITQETNRIFDPIIEEHKSNKTLLDPKDEDLVDVLLRHHVDNINNPDHFSMTTDNIKGVIMELLGGGTENSSSMIEWTMSELLRNPTTLEKAQAEVRRVYKDIQGAVDESRLNQLTYLKHVIKESLRLHPPVPLLAPRESMERCQIYPYDIPAKTRVIINVWAIGRDPEYWPEPEKFYPERFEDSLIDYKGSNYELLPFGAGRRG